ncbi:hypothetical protein GCM10009548_11680 [Streptomyces malaysiensis subsp. malaysiensis]|uniref:DUF1902 domain-containing protein n=1 Tax=Streptomyces malaysiensis TaxID=92644 RepID=A0ABX6WBZ4_STRMQ|nr:MULTISPECIES: hypothetical protein [Streptomyces]QPI57371.1 hypothetical protein I1A49_22855 [Streptomyces solisilvae]UHH18923.1 hypothetical protein LUV23_23040 [Streptomyces sp. HNM0561]
MKSFIGHHEVATDTDYLELALGTPLELWLGEKGESAEECAARLDAARDILADDPELIDSVSRIAAEAIEAHAPVLFHSTGRLPRPARSTGRTATASKAVAA